MNEYLWTLCRDQSEDSLSVNPAPSGDRYIHRQPISNAFCEDIQYQYDGGDTWGGWIIQRSEFNCSIRFSDDPPSGEPDVSEDFISREDFVVSTDGKLIGFVVGKHKVFWIEDFQESGKYYDAEYLPDLILEKRYAPDLDKDLVEILKRSAGDLIPDPDIFSGCHVVYGYLTHSRW